MDTDASEMIVKVMPTEGDGSKVAPVVENGHDGQNAAGTSGIEVKIENGSSKQSESDPQSFSNKIPSPSLSLTSDLIIGLSTSLPTSTSASTVTVVDGEVSFSSLRRSTRASALKAQEKLKVKDGMDVYASNGLTHHHHNHHESSGLNTLHGSIHKNCDNLSAAINKDETASKRSKLHHGLDLDQYDCKFGVRMDKDDVYMLTDESEISSLNSAEVSGLRKNYEEFKSAVITEEQRFERDLLVRELETSLRFEENKLITLKKVVQNQKEAEVEQAKRAKHLSEITERQRQATQAYKPTVAPNPAKVNGAKNSKSKINAREHLLNHLDPAQQQLIFQKLLSNPAFASQAQQLLPKHVQQMLASQLQQNNLGKSSSVNSNLTNLAAVVQAQQQHHIKKEPLVPTITPAQRAAEARRKLRHQLDQQLLSQPPPKGLPTEMNFVPSATNDFCYLLGLDLTVQRVLKDKNVFKKYEEQPYVCEECHTDFTPSWKAIGASENDLHLYCEACVKTAQKRQMKANHASMYKKLFAKIAEQEKELEKQIAAGKFDDPPAPPPAPPSKPSTPVNNPKASSSSISSSASAGNVTMANMAYMMAQAQQQQQIKAKAAAAAAAAQAQQPSTSAQASRSTGFGRGTKRPANSTPQPSSSSQSHQQQALINMLRANPMLMASMMAGGGQAQAQQMAALMQLMSSQQANSGGSNRGSSSSNANNNQSQNNLGTLALLQAAMQQQMQQQIQANTNGGNSSSNSAQQMLQLAMFQNQNMLAMMNPAMLQNFQRMAAANNKSKK